MDQLVPIGRLGRPHGVRGGITMLVEVDRSLLTVGTTLQTADGATLVIRSVSPYRDRGLILQFDGVATREEAEQLRGVLIVAPATASSDPLIGLVAVSPDGAVLGTVTGIDPGAAQDRLVVTTPDGVEVLVPHVAALVGEPDGGRLEIRDPGGLFSR